MSDRSPLTRGDLVLVRFPFTDLSGEKRRPSLVVGDPRRRDVVVAFVTSQIAAPVDATEYVLERADREFATTGLKTASLVRLHRLATVDRSLITVRIGRIGPRTAAAMERGLRNLFNL